jgi:hypothetical protein
MNLFARKLRINNKDCVIEFAGFEFYRKKPMVIRATQIEESFEVDTPEGTMSGNAGDWLIIGVKGEIYPCKPDVFEASYERIYFPISCPKAEGIR